MDEGRAQAVHDIAYREAVAKSSRWYVQPDDEIGGWCIVNHPGKTPATIRRSDWEQGFQVISQFCSKTIAEHIVKLHNATLTENESAS